MPNDDPTRIDTEIDIFAIRRPVWDDWQSTKSTRLWKAVALLCNIDPIHVAFTFDHDYLSPTGLKRHPENFTEHLTLAKSQLGTAQLKPLHRDPSTIENSEVNLTTFATWATSIGIPLPQGFLWQPKMKLDAANWPWGTHSTKLLELLAGAADRYWKNYDPRDRTSAPTNDEVIDWLMTDKKVSKNIATAIATILRADGLPTGPRK